MRHWAHAAAVSLALCGLAPAQQDMPAGMPREQLQQEFAMIQAALQTGRPLDPAARSHRFDGEEAARLFTGKRWALGGLHLNSRYDFFEDGRLRTTTLPSPPYPAAQTVRMGEWAIEGDRLCLIFAESGAAARRSCIVGYGLGNSVVLAVPDDNTPAKGTIFGVLTNAEAIPD